MMIKNKSKNIYEWKYTVLLFTKLKCLMKPVETIQKMTKDVLILKELIHFENQYCNDNLGLHLKICNLYNKYIENKNNNKLLIKLLKLNNSIVLNDENWNYFKISNNKLLEHNLEIIQLKLELNVTIIYNILSLKLLPSFLESNTFKNIVFSLYYYEINNPYSDLSLHFTTVAYNIKYNNNYKKYWLELFKNVADSIPDISLIVCNMEMKEQPIIYMNEDEFTSITGYDNRKIGSNPRFLQCEHTNNSDIKRISQSIKTKSKLNINILNQRKNGDIFWMHLSIIPILDINKKNVIYSIGIQLNLSKDLNYIDNRISRINKFCKNIPSCILSNQIEDYNLFYYSLKKKVKKYSFSNFVLINYIKLWCYKLDIELLKYIFEYASKLYVTYNYCQLTSNITSYNKTDNVNQIHAYYINKSNITNNTNIYNFKIHLNKTKKIYLNYIVITII